MRRRERRCRPRPPALSPESSSPLAFRGLFSLQKRWGWDIRGAARLLVCLRAAPPPQALTEADVTSQPADTVQFWGAGGGSTGWCSLKLLPDVPVPVRGSLCRPGPPGPPAQLHQRREIAHQLLMAGSPFCNRRLGPDARVGGRGDLPWVLSPGLGERADPCPALGVWVQLSRWPLCSWGSGAG